MLQAAKLELQQTHENINLKSWDRVALIYKHIHEEKITCYEWEFLRGVEEHMNGLIKDWKKKQIEKDHS